MKNDSYVKNSFLQSRPGDEPLFSVGKAGDYAARLDGYAVIPMEEWERLRVAAGEPIDRDAFPKLENGGPERGIKVDATGHELKVLNNKVTY